MTRPVHAERSVEQLSHVELLERFHVERDRANALESKLNAGEGVARAGSGSVTDDERKAFEASLADMEKHYEALIEAERAEKVDIESKLSAALSDLEAATAPKVPADAPAPLTEEAKPSEDPAPEQSKAEQSKAEEPKTTGSKSRNQRGS